MTKYKQVNWRVVDWSIGKSGTSKSIKQSINQSILYSLLWFVFLPDFTSRATCLVNNYLCVFSHLSHLSGGSIPYLYIPWVSIQLYSTVLRMSVMLQGQIQVWADLALAPLLTTKSCKFSLFEVVSANFPSISILGPLFLQILGPALCYNTFGHAHQHVNFFFSYHMFILLWTDNSMCNLVMPNIKYTVTSHPFSKWDKVYKDCDSVL